jgi:hypothetical protein
MMANLPTQGDAYAHSYSVSYCNAFSLTLRELWKLVLSGRPFTLCPCDLFGKVRRWQSLVIGRKLEVWQNALAR